MSIHNPKSSGISHPKPNTFINVIFHIQHFTIFYYLLCSISFSIFWLFIIIRLSVCICSFHGVSQNSTLTPTPTTDSQHEKENTWDYEVTHFENCIQMKIVVTATLSSTVIFYILCIIWSVRQKVISTISVVRCCWNAWFSSL